MSGLAMHAAAPARTAPLRRILWMHPEWWVVLAAAAAWVALAFTPHPAIHADAHAHMHAGHAMGAADGGSGMPGAFGMLGLMALRAGLMIVAMMLPLTLTNVRHAAFSSLSPRRHRAMGGFIVGFLALWIPVQLLIDGAAAALGAYAGWIFAAGAAGIAAAAWEASATPRGRMRRCHATAPLSPRGWRADADCMRYGAVTGRHCVVSCWALMALCSAAGHALPVMAAIFAVQWTGRDARWRSLRWAAVLATVCAVAAAVLRR